MERGEGERNKIAKRELRGRVLNEEALFLSLAKLLGSPAKFLDSVAKLLGV
jgi:hypothetical protein